MFKSISRNLVHLLLLIVFFAGAGSALAQFDTLSDADREYLFGKTTDDIEVEEEEEEADEEPGPTVERPAVETCPDMPESIVVIGYVASTQCQQVSMAGIGRMDLINLGIANTVDIWGNVPSSVDICFQQSGYLVFLDAAYAPRMLKPLLSFERDDMTCGRIDRAGTVILLHNPYPFETPLVPASAPESDPGANPAAATESSPSCHIKLTEALFLREAPGGRIIGIVWLNSEVPVYETDGNWYKIAFEGQTGYISRDYSRILRGDCR